MIATPQTRRRARFVVLVGVSVVVFYIATVGAVRAMARFMADGQLRSLRSYPIVVRALQFYELPAQSLAAFAPLRSLFELSADVWYHITNAPDTTL